MIAVVAEPGQQLYARFNDPNHTAVDLPEGDGLGRGLYIAEDDAIALAPGTYVPRVYVGRAATQSADDKLFGYIPEFLWSGSRQAGRSMPLIRNR